MTDDDDATLARMLAAVRAAPTPLPDATRAAVLAQVLAAPRSTPPVEPAVAPITVAARRRAWAVGAGLALALAAGLALWIAARPRGVAPDDGPPAGDRKSVV